MPQEARKEFFINYLEIKGKEYHSNQAEYLRSLMSPDNQSLHETIENAIKQEELSARLLVNPSENVLKVELLKMQYRHTLNNDAKYLKEQIQLFRTRLVEFTEALMQQPVTKDEREYLKNAHTFFESYKNFFYWQNIGDNIINDSELLINKIFRDNPISCMTKPTVETMVTKASSVIGIPLVVTSKAVEHVPQVKENIIAEKIPDTIAKVAQVNKPLLAIALLGTISSAAYYFYHKFQQHKIDNEINIELSKKKSVY